MINYGAPLGPSVLRGALLRVDFAFPDEILTECTLRVFGDVPEHTSAIAASSSSATAHAAVPAAASPAAAAPAATAAGATPVADEIDVTVGVTYDEVRGRRLKHSPNPSR